MTFVLTASGCPDGGGSDSSEICVAATDTDGVVATMGTPYGDPWQLPLPPDLGDVRLDVGLPTDFGTYPDLPPPGPVDDLAAWPPAPPPDPDAAFAWHHEPDAGLWWRHATPRETAIHAWAPDTLLVVDPRLFAALRQDLRAFDLHLPIPEESPRIAPDDAPDEDHATVVSVTMERRTELRGPVVVTAERRADGRLVTRRSRPAFAFYLSEDTVPGQTLTADDVGARAWLGPEGTVDVLGYAEGRTLSLRGPLRHAQLDGPSPVPEAGVFVLSWPPPTNGLAIPGPPQPASPVQCTDGFDNDPDGNADACDHNCVLHPAFDGARYGDQPPTLEHARNVALVGDAVWCTMRPETWTTELMARGQDAAQYLNWIEIPPEFDQGRRPAPVVVRDLACVVAPDEATARDCHEDGEACAGILDGYPLAGVRRFASSYIDHAWDYFVWLLDGAGVYQADGPAPVPVSLLQVVAGYEELFETIHSLTPIAGLADATHFQPNLGTAGASVVVGSGNFDKPCNGAHEFGHTLGLPHDLGEVEVPGVGTLLGLMHFAAGDCAPVLGKRDTIHAPKWNIADMINTAWSFDDRHSSECVI